ncbi:MAG: hypothetical protein WDZ91_10195 [Paenibacillaceae bacterium]
MITQSDLQRTLIKKEASNLHILKLSMLYFSTGMIMFLVAMVCAVWILPELVRAQSMRMPDGWFLAHLLLLGWATTVAMGASFQLVQVVMRTSLFSRKMGYIQYVLYTIGYVAMITGFLAGEKLIVIGGTSVAAAVLLYAINMVMTFIRAKEWNIFVFGVCLSIMALLLTIALGIRMGLSFAYEGYSNHYEVILGSHLWFGIAGWLSGFIIIFSIKLLPMFYVSSKKPELSTYWLIGLFHVGVWLQALALWSNMDWVAIGGSACMYVALGWFILYVYDIRRKSRSKRPVGVVSIALHLISVIVLLFILANGYDLLFRSYSHLYEILITIVVLGWFSPTILSYLSKILPFLWWAHRYQTKEEKKNAVLLTNMLPERRMTLELVGYVTSIAIVIVGYALVVPVLAVIGQIAAVGLSVVYLVELSRTFRY